MPTRTRPGNNVESPRNTATETVVKPAHDAAVAGMFGRIVPFYDLLNRVLSLGLDQYWRKVLAQNVRLGDTGRVLDLAAGTLDVSLAIRRRPPSAIVPAMDFCPPMLTIAFGIRNILPREAAFAEMLRVLRPGGRACILEFGSGQERIWGGLYNVYLNHLLPRVGKVFSKDPGAYEYLADTIRKFPSALSLEKEMRAAGFERAWHEKLTSGIVCLHVGEKAR